MNKSIVSIVRAPEYDCDYIYSAVAKGVDLLGGLDNIVKPGSKIFVKINHLPPPSPPERGIVTHPVFVEAVLKLLKQYSDDITVGDDIESDSGEGFKISGFHQMCQRVGVRLINLKETGFIETECNGYFLKTVYLSKIALDADIIVNLPKFKTHSLTIITGAVKNMYGTIPDSFRKSFHGQYIPNQDFSQVVADIFSAVKPHLNIMDGIIAMEGEGPALGNIRKPGIVLASQDAVALDSVAATIIGLNPMDIYTIKYSHERALGIGNLQQIEAVGESIASVAVPDFKPPASAINVFINKVPTSLSMFFVQELSLRPQLIENQCTGCLECNKICPTDSITAYGNIVKIDYDNCIKCMCCHEVCRFYAIRPKRSFLGNIFSSSYGTFKKLMLMAKRI